MMKNKLMWFAVMILTVSTAFAQKATFKVQGIGRPDLQDKVSSMARPTAKATDDNTFSFSDINFWVGEGTNQAALVIDWQDESLDHALVWGYRWNGEATGIDMLMAVAAADSRFTLLTHETNLGNTVAGLGFNSHSPYQTKLLYIKDNDTTWHTPQGGVVTADAYNYDNWQCSDPIALWRAGWYDGYWSYQVKDNVSEDFTYSGLGASSRKLTDGCVDGWSFALIAGTTEGTLPRMPFEAASPAEPTDANAYWGQMYKNAEHQSIVDLPLAIAPNQLSVKWEYPFSGYSGQPIVVGDYMYNTTGKKIIKISLHDGSLVAEHDMIASIGFFSMIAYGDGKIFVTLGSGVTQAFDAVTLKPLWQSKVEVGGQQLCPIVYHDGHIYTGTWNGGSPATGVYYCLSTEDDDPEVEDEIKTPVWQSDNTGFYWSGGSIVGDCIFVGGDDGVMRSYNRLTGEVIDEWVVAPDVEGSTIRSGTSYDEKTQRLFFTAKEALKICSVKINPDGTFDNASKLSTEISGQPTTTPTVYNGRVYATSGTMTSGGGFDVLDAETLERIYTVDMGGISQSTPVVCTAFANEGNRHEVYIYVCLNNNTGDLVCIKDFEGNTEPIVQYKWQAPKTQYCTHSMVVDQYGTMYYKNDSRGFWALESKGVLLSQPMAKIGIDEELTLQAHVVTMKSNKEVSWTSTNEDVATVDASGLVKGLAAGQARIVVDTREGGFTDTCTVNVYTPLTVLALDSKKKEMSVGDVAALNAVIQPGNSEEDLVWTSSAPAVCTVDESGSVKAVAAGEARIIVATKDGRLSDTCLVKTVPVAVTGVEIATVETTVGAGGLQVTASVLPENATNQNVTWKSSDETVASVSETGFVTPLKPGEATITVTTQEGGFSDTHTVTVDIVPVESVKLSLDTLSLVYNGSNFRLTATVSPSSASIKTVSFESSDESVATVNEYGWVWPQNIGEARVIARTANGGPTDTCVVKVEEVHVAGIALANDTLRITDGRNKSLGVTFTPATVSNKNVSWLSTDETVATVTASYNGASVKPAGNGETLIIARSEDGGFTDTCVVLVSNMVVNPATGVVVSNKTLTLTLGGSGRMLTATVLPDTATNKNITWRSTDETVATVSAMGTVKAIAEGEALIIVTTVDGGFAATCTLTVKAKQVIPVEPEPIAVTEVRLDIADSTLYIDGTLALTATVLPDTATNKDITWRSTDEAVATVNAQGMVKAIAEGQALIIVTTVDGGFSDTCTLTVKKKNGNTEPAFTFDDINFWVGEGSNQAALVIDWQDERLDHALVWGYRWNGEATGTDMIIAIAQADPRLTLLTHETQYGNTVAGIGFKRNAPGEMTLTFAPEGEEARVVVPENGIVITDNSDYDSWSASEDALWRSGWNTDYFWAYLVADDAADELISASTGASDRKLTDGCMDVWNWDSYPSSTEPRMPYEAVTPISIIPATGVRIDIADSTLNIGESLALTATVLPDTATDKSLTWRSTDETVATVNAQGMVKAIAEGKALIIVTTVNGGFADTCTITVVKNDVANQDAQTLAISVYPNPTASDVNVKLDETALLEVFASNGRLMLRKQVPAGIQTIRLETGGLYFIRVSSGNRSTVVRVIKR
ncbi:MAG: Ig-like domain-containing protein [Bacteroides sp.]|nr:Ig-like domain-containing protein [Ruminococcus flavefaciens]MCM1554481.1 Ig-like domain-containing protein [Bacteroides sp.]